MIVWGGFADSPPFDPNSGGRYDPVTDSWTPTATANAPGGREGHTAVWTANEMIVWGGANEIGLLDSGGRYDPATNSWTATGTANAPSPRWRHTAVWTGSEMIIWGGSAGFLTYFNTGGRYDPAADSWTPTTTDNAPSARSEHTEVWTGSEMIVWGGGTTSRSVNFDTGGRYCARGISSRQ